MVAVLWASSSCRPIPAYSSCPYYWTALCSCPSRKRYYPVKCYCFGWCYNSTPSHPDLSGPDWSRCSGRCHCCGRLRACPQKSHKCRSSTWTVSRPTNSSSQASFRYSMSASPHLPLTALLGWLHHNWPRNQLRKAVAAESTAVVADGGRPHLQNRDANVFAVNILNWKNKLNISFNKNSFTDKLWCLLK